VAERALVTSMTRAVLLLIGAMAFLGCVNETVVYHRNLSPNYVSPHARLLSEADRQQIARIMAHRTSQPMIDLCAGRGKNEGKFFVYTGYIGAKERGEFGFFTLTKINATWQIIGGGTDLDPILVGLLCSDDR
jgi:hypothetical protein